MAQRRDILAHILQDYSRLTQKPRPVSKSNVQPWLRCAAAASAGLTAAVAGEMGLAAVMHSGPVNELLRNDDFFEIDLDSDGVDDFRAQNEREVGFTYYGYVYTNYWLADIGGLNGGIVVDPVGIYSYVRKLGMMSAIDNNQTFGNFPTLAGYRLVHTSFSGQDGEYLGNFGGTGFAGVRFGIGGQNHFGWIQISVNDFDRSYRILDWAYESVPNMPIAAGDLGADPGEPAGDYNDDGTVNAADYVVWRNNEGTSTELPNDPHGGTIGPDQYNTWRDNFGQTEPGGSAGSASVPEPSAATLGVLALGTVGIAALRRGRELRLES